MSTPLGRPPKAHFTREAVQSLAHFLTTQIDDSPFVRAEVELVGSYLRGITDLGDMDLLVTVPPGRSLLDLNFGEHLEVRAGGPTKILGTLTLGQYSINVDIWACTPEERESFRLFLTGPDNFCVRMRALAKRKKMLLNEHGLFQLGPMRKIASTERGIFGELGLVYESPQERERYASPDLSSPTLQIIEITSSSGGSAHRVHLEGVHAYCDCIGYRSYRACRHIDEARAGLGRRVK